MCFSGSGYCHRYTIDGEPVARMEWYMKHFGISEINYHFFNSARRQKYGRYHPQPLKMKNGIPRRLNIIEKINKYFRRENAYR